MGLMLRWLFRLFFVAFGVIALAVVGVYYFAQRSLPEYEARWRLTGPSAPFEIVRDTANVPHILGQTDEDSFFGLGFVHAQDRLWQMTVMRRTAQGKLSELFGQRTVQIDELMRRFDLYGTSQASAQMQDAETSAALDAYAAGVNAYIDLVNERALGRGAPEFFLFSPEIAPWQPADSIAIGKLMAFQLSEHAQTEVLRAQLSLLLAPERVEDILPKIPGAPVIALTEFASLFPDARMQFAALRPPSSDPLSPIKPRGFAGASNAWAAAPDRSVAGGSLLANDPHLGLTAPSIWYLARLELETGGVIGGTIPGMPLVLVGRSADLGWALTSAYLDDQDLYIERLNPSNPEEYQTPTGFKAFETRRSVIQVKDAGPVTITLRWTENGPVLPGSHYNLATILPPGHVASLAWTALSREDTSIAGTLGFMRAGNRAQAIEAGENVIAPAQNLTLADREGVAMVVVGQAPNRDPRHQSQGQLPSPGWRTENRWNGTLPYATNPRVTDPESNVLGNTNNKTTDAPFPNHLSFDWGDSQRIQRWTKLMRDRVAHTRESFIEAQLDTVSMAARNALPLIAGELWFNTEPAPEGTPERQRQTALQMLADWNGNMNEHMPEPLIYAAWIRQLNLALIRDELGPLADQLPHPDPLFIEAVFRNINGASAWCDIVQSTATETCVDISRRALDAALLEMTETYGRNIQSWRWGDAHLATHDHPVLGLQRGIGPLVNIRQSTSGGDHTLMRGRTIGTGPEPFLNVHAAGYRGVYDFADPDSSVFIISTGQSGHPLSRHYDDLGQLWRRGEYVPMSLDVDLARAAATGITRITPN